MAAFRRLFWAALCAGLLSGAFAAIAHQIGTVPLVLQAETYEQSAPHEAHSAAAWEPENGIERTAYTVVAELLTGIGFALLLAAGLALRGAEASWRAGLLWGLAGFATFTLAPGLGLPPELPGSETAPLVARQLWWLATAAATGSGLALLALSRNAGLACLGAALMVLPHLLGAPGGEAHAHAIPETLAHRFVVATMVASFLSWVVLGASTGYFYRRFGRPIAS